MNEEKAGSLAFADVLKPGTEVKFLDSFHEGSEYSAASSEDFIRQAVAVWVGPRPPHLLRYVITEKHKLELQQHRRHFLGLILEQRLLHVSHARVKGSITGFLTDDIGLLETNDIEVQINSNGLLSSSIQQGREPQLVLFNVKNVHVYRKPATFFTEQEKKGSPSQILPVGLRVTFDARPIPRFRGVGFQAISVMAGTWPSVPHPTLLPSQSGHQSYYGCNDVVIPPEHAFYYLKLSLKDVLNQDVEMFKTEVNRNGVQLLHSEFVIHDGLDFRQWQDIYAPSWLLNNRDRPKRRTIPRSRRVSQIEHIFKRVPLKMKKNTNKVCSSHFRASDA